MVAQKEYGRDFFPSVRADQDHPERQRAQFRGQFHLPDLPDRLQFRQWFFGQKPLRLGKRHLRTAAVFLFPEKREQLLPPGIPVLPRGGFFQYRWQFHLNFSFVRKPSAFFFIIPSGACRCVEKFQKMLRNPPAFLYSRKKF